MITISSSLDQPVNDARFNTTTEIIKNEVIHTYVIMPLNRMAYTVFDRDILMDAFNASMEDGSFNDYDAIVARIKNTNGIDWVWHFENADAEKPIEFIGSLKGCLKNMVQRLDKESGHDNHYTVVARMYNLLEPAQLQNVVSSAQAYPAAEFLMHQNIEVQTPTEQFLNENANTNWRPIDPRFQTTYFVVKDEDPDRPVDHDLEYEKQLDAARELLDKTVIKCWNVSVERGYVEGVQLVMKNRLNLDFDGDTRRAVLSVSGDKYKTICKALATIANNNETDLMDMFGISPIAINSIFQLIGYAKSYRDDKIIDVPEDNEADEIALEEMDEYQDHFYDIVWDCLAEREAKKISNEIVNPLVSNYGWKIFNDNNDDEINEDAEVLPGTVKSLSGQTANKTTENNRLLFGGDDSRNWTKLEWRSAMSIGQRTANSSMISERMFGTNELNYLVKNGMDPYKFYEIRGQWKVHPLVAIAYDMDFAAQFVNDYMAKSGIGSDRIDGGEFGTLMFTSTFTNGSRMFADDQGRVFLKLAFGDDNEYPEDIATNNATLLAWCTGIFNPQNNPKASEFYTNMRNYLQESVKRWEDVRASIKMSGANDDAVLDRFTTLMENFPERKSETDKIVSKFNNYVFGGYNPMENLNLCIDHLSKGNVNII